MPKAERLTLEERKLRDEEALRKYKPIPKQ